MKYMRIQDDVAFEYFETDGDMSTMFHPSLIWANITNNDPFPAQGWVVTKEGTQYGTDWEFAPPAELPTL